LLGGCEVNFGSGGNAVNEAQAVAEPSLARFTNSRANARSDALQRYYVDFSFDYPADWRVQQPTGGDEESNYVNVTAPHVRGLIPYAVNVGYAFGTGNAESDRRELAQALPGIARQFGQGWNDYRITFIGEDQVGRYDSHSWRFSARTADAAATQVHGRGDVILPPGASRGVLIVSIATESGEVEDPAEVGREGPIRTIHDSFSLAASTAADK
jgi:hypothetical protein